MEKTTIQLPDTWLEHLKEEFNQDYMIKLKSKLLELKENKIIMAMLKINFILRIRTISYIATILAFNFTVYI